MHSHTRNDYPNPERVKNEMLMPHTSNSGGGYTQHYDAVKERVCTVENLYKAMKVCKKNVLWKDSVAGYVKNGLVNCMLLRNQLMDGSYAIDKYTVFNIHEPKERVIVSTRFKDRVFQRSLCDNYLVEQVTKSFIYDNCACQKGKGTDFARERLKVHLQRFYRKNKLDGYVLKCDLSNYFGSTPHQVAVDAMRKRIDNQWAFEQVETIIRSYNHTGVPNTGIGLGSQVSQLVELAVLDDIDHYIKEQLHIKYYIRYMDDFILIHENKQYLKYCLIEIRKRIEALGLKLSEKKTQIFPLKQPIRFLGFSFRLTPTGKVIMRVLPEKISHERRKLRRMVKKSQQGLIDRRSVDDSFVSFMSHIQKGNAFYLSQVFTDFYKNLWRT